MSVNSMDKSSIAKCQGTSGCNPMWGELRLRCIEEWHSSIHYVSSPSITKPYLINHRNIHLTNSLCLFFGKEPKLPTLQVQKTLPDQQVTISLAHVHSANTIPHLRLPTGLIFLCTCKKGIVFQCHGTLSTVQK